MNRDPQHDIQQPPTHHRDPERLLSEIAALEHRVARLGLDGDCGYERRMGHLYRGLLEQRRRELAALRKARG